MLVVGCGAPHVWLLYCSSSLKARAVSPVSFVLSVWLTALGMVGSMGYLQDVCKAQIIKTLYRCCPERLSPWAADLCTPHVHCRSICLSITTGTHLFVHGCTIVTDFRVRMSQCRVTQRARLLKRLGLVLFICAAHLIGLHYTLQT